MFLEGREVLKLGSMRDRMRSTVWYRREQRQIFQALINVYSAVIAVNPEVSSKISKTIDDYIELVIPGSNKARKHKEAETLKANSEALDAIYKTIQSHQSQAFPTG